MFFFFFLPFSIQKKHPRNFHRHTRKKMVSRGSSPGPVCISRSRVYRCPTVCWSRDIPTKLGPRNVNSTRSTRRHRPCGSGIPGGMPCVTWPSRRNRSRCHGWTSEKRPSRSRWSCAYASWMRVDYEVIEW